MINWLKEQKVYIVCALLVAIFSGYAFFASGDSGESSPEEDWAIENKAVDTEKEDKEKPSEPAVVKADIKGAVLKPGVYVMKEGDRVIDLIETAGGLSETADAATVNFALHVKDEMAVYIPEKGEQSNIPQPVEGSLNGGTGTSGGTGKIDLNKAEAADLETLPGIGPSKATAILEYRETNGPFKAIEDLKLISGIGDKTFEKLKDNISVN
ncbi:helix-hairpin-helix domain-containing protein [Bacillus sp. T33-2]|uniref:helix-hairpin-helix domain-containing protein n=1 Tax=Bacillus sp. T33-2 TaxID=2054168 RepID=UPI000C767BF6|nr:helix-hairpin-helix domain-containing protein [Bacillus sp. T33-2]PLR93797.1 hypothetical protein CVD19_18925 [Bacillus sp. T33-2]